MKVRPKCVRCSDRWTSLKPLFRVSKRWISLTDALTFDLLRIAGSVLAIHLTPDGVRTQSNRSVVPTQNPCRLMAADGCGNYFCPGFRGSPWKKTGLIEWVNCVDRQKGFLVHFWSLFELFSFGWQLCFVFFCAISQWQQKHCTLMHKVCQQLSSAITVNCDLSPSQKKLSKATKMFANMCDNFQIARLLTAKQFDAVIVLVLSLQDFVIHLP